MNQQQGKDASEAAQAGQDDGDKAAYLIGHIVVKDEASWAEYCRRVPSTVAPWGASLVFRGTGAKVLDGKHDYTDTVVIRFPDRAAIDAWHESAAYQEIVPIRERAADVVIVSYEG
jgi:uncharacterized protein (DUF1330 family)